SRSRGPRWCRFRPPERFPRHWDCCTRSAWRGASATPARRQLAQPPRSRPHYPQRSQRTPEPRPRWGVPGVARGPAPEWRLFETKWCQSPPHTAQSPARTLLLPDACPTSNPKTRQLLGWAWTEFLNPTLVANSRRGQQAPIGTAKTPRGHRGYRRETRNQYNRRPAAGDAGDRVSQRRLDDHRFPKWKAGLTRNVHKFAPMGHTQNGFALAKAA